MSELTGIIPACAGNMRLTFLSLEKEGDHPRVCGEHFNRDYEGEITEGSSPRVRGTSRERKSYDPFEGIIPACAGNIGANCVTLGIDRDHPRVCGEHLIATSLI